MRWPLNAYVCLWRISISLQTPIKHGTLAIEWELECFIENFKSLSFTSEQKQPPFLGKYSLFRSILSKNMAALPKKNLMRITETVDIFAPFRFY